MFRMILTSYLFEQNWGPFGRSVHLYAFKKPSAHTLEADIFWESHGTQDSWSCGSQFCYSSWDRTGKKSTGAGIITAVGQFFIYRMHLMTCGLMGAKWGRNHSSGIGTGQYCFCGSGMGQEWKSTPVSPSSTHVTSQQSNFSSTPSIACLF